MSLDCDLINQFDLREHRFAAAVSGGPDSMALVKLLSLWAQSQGEAQERAPHIHALIVDHNLRPESRAEAGRVHARLKTMAQVTPTILTAQHLKGQATKIQETARHARYELMAQHCQAHNITHLFLGHHQDDQAETVLFRLAKGSGLDGLTGMRAVQKYDDTLTLLRPFLLTPKSDLEAFCVQQNLDVEHDPSNENTQFARIRLRRAKEILQEEGLSAKRLSTLAHRLARAQEALDTTAQNEFIQNLAKKDSHQIVLNCAPLSNQPDEIVLRIILIAMRALMDENRTYDPRMEKSESLCMDLKVSLQDSAKPFRKRTLGGLIFDHDVKHHTLIITKEKNGESVK